jgi:hypothetical protein
MPTLPSATTTIDPDASPRALRTDYCCVISCVPTNADETPRVYGNWDAIKDQHGYSEGLEYAALHFAETRKPLIFIGIPIDTLGVIGREDTSGNTGTSVTTVAAAGTGTLAEHDGVLTCITGGTIGTIGIILGLSLDGGRTTKRVKLGTANSYTVPNVGATISFAAGTLVAGDTVHTWHGTAPFWAQADLEDARQALAAQQKGVRSLMVVGDLENSTQAGYITTEVNAYETTDERFVYARSQVRDRLPLSLMSQVTVRMSGTPTVTFAEVGATGDTITRSAGSFVTDGFVAGDIITITGAINGANNQTTLVGIANVAATVITLDTDDLVDEVATAGVTITGTPALTFAEVGATGDTLTRSRGSWLDDGFRSGDLINITGTSLNNITGAAGVTTVTATVITFDTDDLAAEVIGSSGVTVQGGETKAAWVAAMDTAFASVDSQKRIDLALGRGRKQSPITGYLMRRPASWAASIREYQHDVHIPTFRKSDGPLDGWSLDDAAGNLYEFDERVDSGGLAGNFTVMRTWGNGPVGAFMALSLTRAGEGELLSRTQNMSVANVACTVNQQVTEDAIGQVLRLNSDGTATADSLQQIQEQVNSALDRALLQDLFGEGPRASGAYWEPATDDILNVVGATLNGTLTLTLNGTIEHIATSVAVV